MKTTLELPDHLMRAVKMRTAATDRKLKDVVADLIQRGLASPLIEGGNEQSDNPRKKCDALDALFAASDELANSGVDVAA